MENISVVTVLEVYGKVLLEHIVDFEYEDLQRVINEAKQLKMYHDTTVGMFATDRPDLVDDSVHRVLFELEPIEETTNDK